MKYCSNYCLYGCAVGGAHGESIFFKSKQSSQTSSLSKKATELFSKIDGIEERSVTVNRLSDMLDPGIVVDYLKIDVQGTELSIIEDLINHDMLKNVNTLAIEASFLDINSINCVDIIKKQASFQSAYLVNTVYGGGDIVFSKLQESEGIATKLNAHQVF